MNSEHCLSSATILVTLCLMSLPLRSDATHEAILAETLNTMPEFDPVTEIRDIGHRSNAVWGRFISRGTSHYLYYERNQPKSGLLSVAVVYDKSFRVLKVILPEHSGINTRLSRKRFLSRFAGTTPRDNPIQLDRGGIDAVSGATMSAALIVATVNRGANVLGTGNTVTPPSNP